MANKQALTEKAAKAIVEVTKYKSAPEHLKKRARDAQAAAFAAGATDREIAQAFGKLNSRR